MDLGKAGKRVHGIKYLVIVSSLCHCQLNRALVVGKIPSLPCIWTNQEDIVGLGIDQTL